MSISCKINPLVLISGHISSINLDKINSVKKLKQQFKKTIIATYKITYLWYMANNGVYGFLRYSPVLLYSK